KDTWARKEIVECYKGKYAKHSQLEEYIRVSNINQNWRNVFEAIADFEKHISFDVKNFVFHRSWGVGKIVKVDGDQLTINFGKKYGVRDMSLKMAIDALQPLKKDHIWVLKATTKKEELAKKVKDDKTWVLKTIIKSFDNSCDIKRIKLELVPAILSAGEWTSWSNSARKILDSDPTFGVDPNDNSKYVVRDRPITQEEKLANEFKAQKNFFPRIDILMKFANSDETDTNSELFSEMFGYFVGYLRSFSNVDEEIIAAYLVVRRIVKDNPQLNPGITYSFADLFNELEQKKKREVYEKLKDTKNTQLRRDYLNCIRELLPDWADIYVYLFPCVLEESIITSLVSAGYNDKVKQLAEDCFENYRDNREAVLYFFKECQDEDWFKNSDISYEKQLITLIHILDLSYREISNHYETTENRKIVNRITALLFKNDTLLNYALEQGKNTAERLFTLVDDIQDLDAAIKMNGRNKVLEKYPDIKFSETKEKVAAPKGLIVTSKMMEIKKKRLEEIVKVEIPANAKDIAEATAKGDLKENADYSAAKEKQKELGKEASKLEDEIAKATIFNPATVTTTRVSFGTVVTLKNESTGKQEKYTILGPWESDPDNDIISYMSPLGTALQGLTEGAKKTFKIGDNENTVTVLSIKAAKF
ncbi:MAG: transcription elongation factor GreA, partial [Spirochaetaceae bacterium]|nr:transcription elongation factor GreA [Spirochaetaceae bacterium]